MNIETSNMLFARDDGDYDGRCVEITVGHFIFELAYGVEA